MGVLLDALSLFYNVLMILIFARVLGSWFIRDPYAIPKPYYVIIQLTEPILGPFRKLLSRFQGNMGIDISPVLAIIVLNFIYRMLYRFLYQLM